MAARIWIRMPSTFWTTRKSSALHFNPRFILTPRAPEVECILMRQVSARPDNDSHPLNARRGWRKPSVC